MHTMTRRAVGRLTNDNPGRWKHAEMAMCVCVQLKILSWRGDELASDVLPIAGLPRGASPAQPPWLTGSLCSIPCNCSTLTTLLGPITLDLILM